MPTNETAIELHGTEIFRLKPRSIIQAATADLKRRGINKDGPPYKEYAFHRRHVAKAVTERELIEAAIKSLERKSLVRGIESGKRNTRLIYRDIERLREALKLLVGDSADNNDKGGDTEDSKG